MSPENREAYERVLAQVPDAINLGQLIGRSRAGGTESTHLLKFTPDRLEVQKLKSQLKKAEYTVKLLTEGNQRLQTVLCDRDSEIRYLEGKLTATPSTGPVVVVSSIWGQIKTALLSSPGPLSIDQIAENTGLFRTRVANNIAAAVSIGKAVRICERKNAKYGLPRQT